MHSKTARKALSDFMGGNIAGQIAVLRRSRGWTQGELGRRAGMTPNVICRIESNTSGRLTIETLKRLATAFDLCLMITFEEFGSVVTESGTYRDETINLDRRSFDDDPVFQKKAETKRCLVHTTGSQS